MRGRSRRVWRVKTFQRQDQRFPEHEEGAGPGTGQQGKVVTGTEGGQSVMWSAEGEQAGMPSPGRRRLLQGRLVCGAETNCQQITRLQAKTNELRQQIELRLMYFPSTVKQPQATVLKCLLQGSGNVIPLHFCPD